MKILNIIQCSNLGGMEQSTLKSMSVLKEAGHEVMMVSLHPAGSLKPLAEAAGIPLIGIEGYRLGGLANIGVLGKIITDQNPDRIWLTGHNFGSLFAAKRSGIPTYLSIHFHHCERPALLWKVFYGFAKQTCSGIRFICRYIYDEVAHLFKGDKKAECFPNIFLPPTSILDRAAARESLGIPADAFVVGNAGWLIPRKAFDVFLKTAAAVNKQLPDAVFVIAGDGHSRDELEQMAAELGIADQVLFVGWQQDLSAFYAAIDVLLFNSNFDAVGRTPVEALAHGTTVVASVTNGGLNELIRHGQDGFLIDTHDDEAMAGEIVKLYKEPDYRNACIESGRKRVLELGSPEQHLENLTRMMNLK